MQYQPVHQASKICMNSTRTISIPETVLLSAESLDELEDWLAAQNPAFVEELRRIRRDEDLAGQGKTLDEMMASLTSQSPPA